MIIKVLRFFNYTEITNFFKVTPLITKMVRAKSSGISTGHKTGIINLCFELFYSKIH